MSQEKRLYPRVRVNWPITIKTSHGPISAVMRDISAGGALVFGWKPLRPDEESLASNYHTRASKLRLVIGATVVRQDIEQLDDKTMSISMAIQFTKLSGEVRQIISTLVSAHLKGEGLECATDLGHRICGESVMSEDNIQSARVEIKPSSYPIMKLYWKQKHEYENDELETDISLPREFWMHLAKACDEIAHGMGAFSSPKVREALNLMADRIIVEMDAEDRRLRYKESYESFFDLVVAISNRADLDRVRKAQLIHEKALQIQIQKDGDSD
jgi:hypothetical protein